MAKFNQNSLTQVFGFGNEILAAELVYNQESYWNQTLTDSLTGLPIDLTGASIDATIIRRQMTNIHDSRYGLTFDVADYTLSPVTPITMTITNRNDLAGLFTLVIDESVWGVLSTDPQLNINANECVGFTGRIKISFPQSGSTPANDLIVFLLFLVRSDGVVN